METRPNAPHRTHFALALFALLALACAASHLTAQSPPATAQNPAPQPPGPPRNPPFFPLSQVRPGLTATAWTVFEGTTPEPMQVEILGVLRGARGPGQDLILARLLGAKPEYTGVVAGMSGSPVYIDGKLAGALSYRIGQFTKEPIAGITPIEQMLEVRDLSPADRISRAPAIPATSEATSPEWVGSHESSPSIAPSLAATGEANSPQGWETKSTFQPMETPLILSGFHAASIRFWQQQTAGTGLETIAAGGASPGSSAPAASAPPPALEPGSSVSMQLVRGDLEVAATCTVTWIDPTQLLACGHPILGAGPVSLPMTAADVVATVASPLDAFKIINTGNVIGAFTEDRESAIRGVFGDQARMIPMHISLDAPGSGAPAGPRHFNVEILDLPSLTPLAMQVVLLESLTQSNAGSEALSYHLTGSIDLAGYPSMPLDLWAPAASGASASLQAVLLAGQQFTRLYANGARQGVVRQIDLHVQALPQRVLVTLQQAHLVSSSIAHAGDTVEIEATLQPWQQPQRNVRIAFTLPARLAAGNLRLLVSDAATLDRALVQPRLNAPPPDLYTVLAQARNQHSADRIYVSLLAPEAQGELAGQTLSSLPLSMANALESLRNTQDASLNGESAVLAAQAPAGGVLSGFQVINLHIEPGGGLN